MLADTCNYDLQNVECQSLISSCKISLKVTKVRKENNYEPLVTF